MRKRRTRSHIIADLSVNYVERFALRCGYSVERVLHDYGIDLLLYTYDTSGEVENGLISIQLKATDGLEVLSDEQTIAFAVQRADLLLWLRETLPCIFIVYDAVEERAYWIYVQAYFAALPDFDIRNVGETTTVHLKKADRVNEAAIRQFARFKENVLRQTEGVIHTHG